MALKIPSPPSQIDLVLRLEATNDDFASDTIREILENSNDKATVVYGLRVLSKLGADPIDLEAIARRFNGRVISLTEPGQPFYRKDTPCITSYIVENPETGGFERMYLSGISP